MLALLVAGFTGQFSGPGAAITPRRSRECREIFMDIQQTEKQLILRDAGYICEDMQASFDPFVMEIKAGRLIWQGADVGFITPDVLDLNYEDQDEGFTYHLTLKKLGPEIHYFEEWISEGQKALTVEGILK